ncbi:NUDIX hydrolase [Candidatus Methanomassiliicoccus intestinalis]|uniref:NUDIX hydrolase n=1 Tax=Candidatus Methanomassiliicoccus intestinalis TaxID=1406512 RepID=UPI0037DCF58B
MKVEICNLNRDKNDKKIKFVVIGVYIQKKWIFVRHKNRITWEIPGGHVEKNESVDVAAIRELYEETGLKPKKLHPICDYYAENRIGKRSYGAYGRFYICLVDHISQPPNDFEIAEEKAFDIPPLSINLTYPEIHGLLMEKAQETICKLL